jgi:hypothetical protein
MQLKERVVNAGVESVGISIADKTTIGGSAAAVGGSILGSVDWITIGGIVVALLGLVVSTFFQWRRDAREERETNVRISTYQRRAADVPEVSE